MMICESCGIEFFEDFRKDPWLRKTEQLRFCSRSCANRRERSPEVKDKIREGKRRADLRRGVKGAPPRKSPRPCRYCGRVLSPSGVVNHERSCSLNPEAVHKRHSRPRKDIREGYIYKTTNLQNGKIYVGKHVGLPEESKDYLGSGKALQQALLKYGKSSFMKEILEVIVDGDLNERERFWISQCESFSSKGYNLTEGGDGGPLFKGKHHTKDTKDRVAATQRQRAVRVQYSV